MKYLTLIQSCTCAALLYVIYHHPHAILAVMK